MGYDLHKRLSELGKNAQNEHFHAISVVRVFFIALICFFILALIFKTNNQSATIAAGETLKQNFYFKTLQGELIQSGANDTQLKNNLDGYIFLTRLKNQLDDRINLLGFFSNAVKEKYNSTAKSLVINFILPSEYGHLYGENKNFDPFIYLRTNTNLSTRINLNLTNIKPNIQNSWEATFVETILRIIFIFFITIPLWILAAICGFYSTGYFTKKQKFDPILSICDRKRSPFYSGIFGALNINGKISGIETASVGLACPNMVKVEDAQSHKLVSILKSFSAYCNTTLDLTRIILAYRDFPCFVEEERQIDNSEDDGKNPNEFNPNHGMVTNKDGTIEDYACEVLPALLLAHRTLKNYFATNKNILETEFDNKDIYSKLKDDLRTQTEKFPPIAKTILQMLTPERARAFTLLSPRDIATAYLAVEAGKCLVYKKTGNGYLKLSQFPHLQARAILHSIYAYHQDFNGDSRLMIRQAIICSRRHRDFGRSFLPEKMPEQCKALRDILEVLYIDKKKLNDSALITELDAYLDEIKYNWKKNFSDFIKQSYNGEDNENNNTVFNVDTGIVDKSVVLIKQENILSLALYGYEKARLERIHRLMKHAKKFNDALAISAKLPGFKRQLENENETKDERNKSRNWDLVKKMLTRYNWLSTRLNDDSVPTSGLIYGIVLDTKIVDPQHKKFETLVPIRQRRMKELFGANWEKKYYANNPHPNNIKTFVDKEEFAETCEKFKI